MFEAYWVGYDLVGCGNIGFGVRDTCCCCTWLLGGGRGCDACLKPVGLGMILLAAAT